MKAVNSNKAGLVITRRDLLKLAGGILGAGALGYGAGMLNQPTPKTPVSGSLPDYVDDGPGLPVFRGPYLQQAQMAAFLLLADQTRLGELCDRHLNLFTDAPYKYVPMLSSLVMIFSDMWVSSLDERDRQVGLIPETELSFWVPVMALRKTGAGDVPDHPAWFLPCLFVDDGNAIASGREVYGFNKQLAQFQKPADIRDPLFVTSVVGFQEFGASVRAVRQPLLELRRAGSTGSTLPAETWQDWPSAQAALSRRVPELLESDAGGPWVGVATQLAADNAPLVFLKQFRDATEPRLACYQEQLEAAITVKNFYEGGFLSNRYELQINSLASHPLSTLLGLKSQTSTSGVWMKVDFSLGAGKQVWKHPNS